MNVDFISINKNLPSPFLKVIKFYEEKYLLNNMGKTKIVQSTKICQIISFVKMYCTIKEINQERNYININK